MFNSFIITGRLVALLVAYLNGWQYPRRFYYNVRSFPMLPVCQLRKAATRHNKRDTGSGEVTGHRVRIGL